MIGIDDVVEVAQAIIAFEHLLDRLYKAIEERANESQREAIRGAIATLKAAQTVEAKTQAARQIQSMFAGRSGD